MSKNILNMFETEDKCDQIWNSLKENGIVQSLKLSTEYREHDHVDFRKKVVLKALLMFEKAIKEQIDLAIKELNVPKADYDKVLDGLEHASGWSKRDGKE